MIRRSLAAAAVLAVVTTGLVGTSSAVSAAGPVPIDLGMCFPEGGMVLAENGATAFIGCSTGGVARVNLSKGSTATVGLEMPTDVATAGNSAYATLGMSHALLKIPPSGAATTANNFAPSGWPGAVAASPDGSYAVVSVQEDRNYLALVKATGTPAKVFLTGTATKIATYSQGDTDYALAILDVAGVYKLQKVNLSLKATDGSPKVIPGSPRTNLAMAPNGDFAYFAQEDGKIIRFNVSTETLTTVATIPSNIPRAIAFTPDSGWAYILGDDPTSFAPEVHRINTSNGAVALVPGSYGDLATGIAVAPTGDKFYVAGAGQQNLLFTTAIAIPAVTGIAPARVSHLGGDSITITGRNLDALQSVTIGNKDCPVATSNSTKIVCTVPAGPVDKSGSVDVIVKTNDGRTVVSGMLDYVLEIGPATGVDAFTSASAALIYFVGSSLKTAYLKGYQISVQTMRPNGSGTPWTIVKTIAGSATATTLSRAALGVDAGDVVRFRVNVLATTGGMSRASDSSPWRQMTDTVATPTNFSASYDAKTDYLTMRWDEPRGEALGGRNAHGYEFQYMWPGSNKWTVLGDPLRGGTTSAVFSLENVPKGTFKVRIRAISWPEKYLSDWTAEAAIRK
ncbi:MAG: IPT/TIG domain-containing protein [Actinobacteria bacterium]|nr:IPT/TIG domain-containing protein [Actinomycetota bacterium]